MLRGFFACLQSIFRRNHHDIWFAEGHKNGEYRTIATPGEIATIIADGHTALVQRGAGEKAGFSDEAYVKAVLAGLKK